MAPEMQLKKCADLCLTWCMSLHPKVQSRWKWNSTGVVWSMSLVHSMWINTSRWKWATNFWRLEYFMGIVFLLSTCSEFTSFCFTSFWFPFPAPDPDPCFLSFSFTPFADLAVDFITDLTTFLPFCFLSHSPQVCNWVIGLYDTPKIQIWFSISITLLPGYHVFITMYHWKCFGIGIMPSGLCYQKLNNFSFVWILSKLCQPLMFSTHISNLSTSVTHWLLTPSYANSICVTWPSVAL